MNILSTVGTTSRLLNSVSEWDHKKVSRVFKQIIRVIVVLTTSEWLYREWNGNYLLIDFNSNEEILEFFAGGMFFYSLFLIMLVLVFNYYVLEKVLLWFLNEALVFVFNKVKGWFKYSVLEDLRKEIKRDKDGIHKASSAYKFIRVFVQEINNYTTKKFRAGVLRNQSISVMAYFVYLIAIKGSGYYIPNLINFIVHSFFIYYFTNQVLLYWAQKLAYKKGHQFDILFEGFDQYTIEMNSKKEGILPDNPVQRIRDNQLKGRDEFARLLRDGIRNYSSKSGLVIGIDGSWGDGKTSLINMAFEKLKFNQVGGHKIMEFRPWVYTDSNQLIINFIDELKKFILFNFGRFQFDSARIAFEAYAELISTQLKSSRSSDEAVLVSNEYNISRTLTTLNNELLSLQGKVIVVIDDMDRLTPEEILNLFKLVKSVAAFPNIIYIIPFDYSKTVDRINLEYGKGYGEEYLEKIIQVDISLPPALEHDVKVMLDVHIKSLTQNQNVVGWDQDRWNAIFKDGLKYYIRNIRDVKRLINSINFYWLYKSEDLNIIDYVVLRSIYLFDRNLYNVIGHNKSVFTGKTSANDLDELLSVSIIPVVDEVKVLLGHLFPNAFKLTVSSIYVPSDYYQLRKQYKIAVPEEFDKFFFIPVAGNPLTNTQIISTLKASKLGDQEFEKRIESLITDKTIYYFLDRSSDFQNEIEQIADIHVIVRVMKKLTEKIEYNSVYTYMPVDTVAYMLKSYLVRLGNEERLKICQNVIEGVDEDSYYFSINFLAHLYSQHGKIWPSESIHEGLRVLEIDQLDDLNLKIQEVYFGLFQDENSRLNNNLNISMILWLFTKLDFENKHDLKDVLSGLFRNDGFFIRFIESAWKRMSNTNSYKISDLQLADKMRWVNSIYPIEELIAIANNIAKKETYAYSVWLEYFISDYNRVTGNGEKNTSQ